MTTKHTPGPWSTEVDRKKALEINIVSGNRPFVATAWPANHPDKEQEANARLIAAAPDLLKALEELLEVTDFHELYGSRTEAARAAIAKATGEQQ